jgi:hypothetical protein
MILEKPDAPALSARFVAAAEIRAINRNRAGNCFVRLPSGDRLTDFLQENERRLIGSIPFKDILGVV